MKLSDFKYPLPRNLIAKFPAKPRDHSRLMILNRADESMEDRKLDEIVDPARKVRIGNKIFFDNGKLWCEVIDNTTSRGRTVRFNHKGDFFKIIERIGITPLPYYIKREATEKDKEPYQTVYARVLGAVAAPTAGLHFTKQLLKKLENKGVKIVPVLLHVGLGSFRAVEGEDLTKRKRDSEYYEIPQEAATIITKTIDAKHNVFGV